MSHSVTTSLILYYILNSLVSVEGRVTAITSIHEFERTEKKGTVFTMRILDQTSLSIYQSINQSSLSISIWRPSFSYFPHKKINTLTNKMVLKLFTMPKFVIDKPVNDFPCWVKHRTHFPKATSKVDYKFPKYLSIASTINCLP
jgi:hypothetical protein